MEDIIEKNGREEHHLSWTALSHEDSINASETTIRLIMGILNFRYYKTCKKKRDNPSTAANRTEWS